MCLWSCQQQCWTFSETHHGFRAPGRHLMPHPLFPPSCEHAFHAARGCVCLFRLPARPRSPTRHCPGLSVKGRTHASGWRYESRTDPPVRARLDLVTDALWHALEAGRHHQPHGCRNAQVGRITCFIFKTDRAGPCCAPISKPWVGATTWWSRVASYFLTTDLPGDGIRPVGDRYGIPHFFQYLPAVRAAGSRPRNTTR